MSFEYALFLLPGLIIGLTVHEAAHAISAKWLGDCTSEKMGRISLNPLRHLSIYGTLALFFLGFGWGKPVIVNIYNFKKPKFHYLLSSLAGPASNLIICGICLGVLYMQPSEMVYNFLVAVFFINGMLAMINLLPIPPLDGSKIWPCLIPGMKPTISGKWSMVWIVVLIISLQTGGIAKVLGPVQNGMFRLLPESKHSSYVQSERPEHFPEELRPPGNAKNVVYVDKDPDKKGISFDCYGMSFLADGSGGKEASYVSIEQRFRDFGWRRLKYKLDEPESVNEGPLLEVSDEGSGEKIKTDYWVKSPGLAAIISRYRIDSGDKRGAMFSVLYIDDISEDMLEDLAEYKKVHPDELEGISFGGKESPKNGI